MNKIVEKVEFLVCQKWKKSFLFALNSFLFIIWFSAYTYQCFKHYDVMKLVIITLQYLVLAFMNFYIWNKISQNPQYASLRPNIYSYIRYLLLLNYKEANFADKTKNYSFKCIILMYNFYQNFYIYTSILDYKQYAFYKDEEGKDKDQEELSYWFVICSIVYQSYQSYMIIHNISNNSRYRFSKLRNILVFGYLFCSIYTMYISEQFIENKDLHLNLIILTILINFISFWIAFNKPIEVTIFSMWMRILLKGCMLLLLFTTNQEIQICPIYNNALSEYYQYVNTLPFKLYRLLKFLKISILLFLSYNFYTSDFEKQMPYFSSLCIFGIYLSLTFLFILHDGLTIIFPVTVDIRVAKQNEADIQNEDSQGLNDKLALNDQQNSFIYFSQSPNNIQKQSIFHQLNKINFDSLDSVYQNQLTKQILLNIFDNKLNVDFIIGEKDDFWFAKNKNNLVILIKYSNFESIINALKQGQFTQQQRLLLGITPNLDITKQQMIILTLQINIFYLDVFIPSINFFSEELITYMKNFKFNKQSTFLPIISFSKNIANFQYINPVQLIYDLHDQ